MNRKKIIHWFSGLEIEKCQKSNKLLSKILTEIKGQKYTSGNICIVRPCSTHIYAKSLCSHHYNQISKLKKNTGSTWDKMNDLFFNDDFDEPASTKSDGSDPLLVLIRR